MTPQEFIEEFKQVAATYPLADLVAVIDVNSGVTSSVEAVEYDDDAMTIWIKIEEY